MVNELQIINIEGVECYEKDGIAYLKLETVARGLGFTREKNGVEYVMWDRVMKYLSELSFHTCVENGVPTCGHDDFIPENIFYRLAMKAKNETAEKFQAKVADEIIPSIRKHGGYIDGQESLSDEELLAKALLVAQNKITENQKQIEKMKPHAILGQAITTANTSILVGDLAKILKQNGIEIGAKRLFEWMRDNGYLIKRKGTDWNLPTQRSMELGIFEIKESVHIDGNGCNKITRTPKVTGRGQQYFINKFLGVVA